MYICPTCHRGFTDKEVIAKHSLQCWKEHNPNHQSTPAPCKSTTKHEINDDVINFFARFEVCQK